MFPLFFPSTDEFELRTTILRIGKKWGNLHTNKKQYFETSKVTMMIIEALCTLRNVISSGY